MCVMWQFTALPDSLRTSKYGIINNILWDILPHLFYSGNLTTILVDVYATIVPILSFVLPLFLHCDGDTSVMVVIYSLVLDYS